jgi:O-antigen/teichoic acid export membrane protein
MSGQVEQEVAKQNSDGTTANASRSPSLRNNLSWTMAGNSFYALTQWLVLVLLARLGNQEEVGQYALATAISTPIFALTSLKLRSVQATDVLDDFRFETYGLVRLVTVVIAWVGVTLAAWFQGLSGALLSVVLIVAAMKGFEALSDILYGLQQRHERMENIARSLILRGGGSVVAFAGGYLLFNSLPGGVFGMAIIWLATLLLFDAPNARRVLAHQRTERLWDWASMWQLVQLALPLGITVAIGSLSSNVPRYFAAGMLSTYDLGALAAVTYLLVAGNLVLSAVSQAVTPRLATYYRNGQAQRHMRMTMWLLVVGTGIGIMGVVAVILVGEEALVLVYGNEYAPYTDLLLLAAINVAISYSYVFLGTSLTSMKMFKVQLPVHLVGLVVLIAACWYLIPRMGLNGVVWAMIVTNLFQAGAYAVSLARVFFFRSNSDGDEQEVQPR